MILKVIIADDDEGMRVVLRKIINKRIDYKLVAEAENGQQACEKAEELKPDIVFLDVEMPVIDGVKCAKKILDINPKTFIIFATAYEEYMMDAFEMYAFDYLIKPFNIKRINDTLDKVIRVSKQTRGYFRKDKQKKNELKKLMIKNKDSISIVGMEEILLIQREDRITAVYTKDDRYTTSEGLTDIYEKLDKDIFFRSHKSYIVNLTMIHKIHPYGRWTYTIDLKDTSKDALLTYKKYEELQQIFKN